MGFFAKLMGSHSDSSATRNKFLLLSDESSDIETDMIVAQGVDGEWIYRKWSSGIMECWGRTSWSDVDIDTSWGYGYYTNCGDVPDYPFAFVNYPSINMTIQVSNANGLGFFKSNASKTNAGTVYVYSPAVISRALVICNMYAIGRWK